MASDELLRRAGEVQQNAHAPYSRFRVGAAVRSGSGRVYVGCNVENASYGATICAERSAICAMVAAGETQLVEVAIVADGDEPAMPCGVCRQVMTEFGTEVAIVTRAGAREKNATLSELMPEPFVFEPKEA